MSKDNNFEGHAHALVLFVDEILKKRNLTQSWLSEKTGISRGLISNYLKLNNIPTLTAFLKMLHALEVNIFFEPRDSDTDLSRCFENAMDRIGLRNN